MTELRARHATPGNSNIGVDGMTGKLIDVTTLGIWDTFTVKQQIIKTAIEAVSLLNNINSCVSSRECIKA